MRSRLVTLLVLAVAAAAVAFVVTRAVPSSSPSGSAPLPTSPASYLGVYEHGPPGYYQPVADVHQGGRPATEPRRVLQRLGGGLPGAVRPDGGRARRRHDRAVGPDRCLGGRDRRGRLRQLPAHVRGQRPGLRPTRW